VDVANGGAQLSGCPMGVSVYDTVALFVGFGPTKCSALSSGSPLKSLR